MGVISGSWWCGAWPRHSNQKLEQAPNTAGRSSVCLIFDSRLSIQRTIFASSSVGQSTHSEQSGCLSVVHCFSIFHRVSSPRCGTVIHYTTIPPLARNSTPQSAHRSSATGAENSTCASATTKLRNSVPSSPTIITARDPTVSALLH